MPRQNGQRAVEARFYFSDITLISVVNVAGGIKGELREQGLPSCIQSRLENIPLRGIHNLRWQLIPVQHNSNDFLNLSQLPTLSIHHIF